MLANKQDLPGALTIQEIARGQSTSGCVGDVEVAAIASKSHRPTVSLRIRVQLDPNVVF